MDANLIARRLGAGVVFMGMLLAPAVVLGQQPSIQVADRAAARAARAEALSEKAAGLYDNPRRWREAASLHLKAAELRPASDARAVEDIVMAARLLYHAGELGHARSTMVDAADRALAMGELIRAANLYIDAAVIAKQQDLDGHAAELTTRAELLANSTLLAEKDRAAILRRVSHRDSPVADPLS